MSVHAGHGLALFDESHTRRAARHTRDCAPPTPAGWGSKRQRTPRDHPSASASDSVAPSTGGRGPEKPASTGTPDPSETAHPSSLSLPSVDEPDPALHSREAPTPEAQMPGESHLERCRAGQAQPDSSMGAETPAPPPAARASARLASANTEDTGSEQHAAEAASAPALPAPPRAVDAVATGAAGAMGSKPGERVKRAPQDDRAECDRAPQLMGAAQAGSPRTQAPGVSLFASAASNLLASRAAAAGSGATRKSRLSRRPRPTAPKQAASEPVGAVAGACGAASRALTVATEQHDAAAVAFIRAPASPRVGVTPMPQQQAPALDSSSGRQPASGVLSASCMSSQAGSGVRRIIADSDSDFE